GDVIDILLQRRRNGRAARHFFRKLIKGQHRSPNRLVTDELASYRVAHVEEMPGVPHDTTQYANNLCEAFHRPTHKKERQMKRFPTVATARKFLSLHGLVRNLVNWGRHAMSEATYRSFRTSAFSAWARATYVSNQSAVTSLRLWAFVTKPPWSTKARCASS
ncbi:MAG: putative transposase, partial [Gammaproteobacteria bacterium]